MFFIYRGIVEVVSEDEVVFDTMATGEAFGELALLFNITRTASVRAQVNTDLFMLSKADINSLMERYPQIQPQIFKIANQRMRLVQSRHVAQSQQLNAKPLPVDEAEFLTPISSFTAVSHGWRPAGSSTSVSALNLRSSVSSESEKPAIPARVDRPDVLTNIEIDGNYEIPKAVLSSQRNDYLEAMQPRDATATVDHRPSEIQGPIQAANGIEIIKEGTSLTSVDTNGEYVFLIQYFAAFEELFALSVDIAEDSQFIIPIYRFHCV